MTSVGALKLRAWKALQTHDKEIQNVHLPNLFESDPHRGEKMTLEAVGIFLDYSKNRLTWETLNLLIQLAEESNSVEHQSVRSVGRGTGEGLGAAHYSRN